ncbi:DUF3823 domain-containing protein [Membranihabitans maritimus]|uniref:DUF3823 domain-containing protein n=1 Tax=Membranihabitans maritimus TaxID=2904244 RepID=UPI001F3C508A|nr:DUF3823 domain-containing protein [Membranihabitans maritimus]
MKNNIYILWFAGLFFTISCGLDNYDEPGSQLFGQITYEGESIGLRGTGEAVQLQLYQDGYELDAPIPVFVKQDGSFEATLFDGEYKLVTRDQNGPWVNDRDTMLVTVNGSAEVNLEVTPYFMLSEVDISLEGKNEVTATFTIDQIAEVANAEYAMVLLGKTAFVDDVVYIGRQDLSAPQVGNELELSMDVSGIAEVEANGALFARVGVRPVGADQAIYSDVVRVR